MDNNSGNAITNTTATLLYGTIVMLMQAGFALLEAGWVRKKNVHSILAKNFIDAMISTIA